MLNPFLHFKRTLKKEREDKTYEVKSKQFIS